MRRYFLAITAVVGVFSVLTIKSQTTLVKDLNLGFSGSYPYQFTNVNGTLFFVANTAAEGFELWKSDGTAAGTVMVKDINTGSGNSEIHYLTNFNDTLYFSAYDTINGQELWKSDGTTAGTVIVKDIWPGITFGNPNGSNPTYLTVFNGAIYFSASGTGNGAELWKSDGTDTGTVMVKIIYPGFPEDLVNANGTLFFRADDGTNGKELWKSDGSTAGTLMVKDINPGSSGSGPIYTSPLTNVNGTLFFWASHISFGTEIWKSDGTDTGTVLVKDIRPGSISSLPTSVKAISFLGNNVFFPANDGINGEELWVTDGTLSGTQLLKDIQSGSNGSGAGDIVSLNNEIYFTAYGGSWELWKSDGSVNGTSLVKSFSSVNSPNTLAVINNTLYLAASDGINGVEFWESDGTTPGTTMIYDINSGSPNSVPQYFTEANGTIFFNADDGINGQELWKYSPSGTGLNSLTSFSNNMLFYPNPFSNSTTLKTEIDLENVTLIIYNSSGQVVKQLLNISGKDILLQKENLPSGLYFIQLIEENELIGGGKLIITTD